MVAPIGRTVNLICDDEADSAAKSTDSGKKQIFFLPEAVILLMLPIVFACAAQSEGGLEEASINHAENLSIAMSWVLWVKQNKNDFFAQQ